MIRIRVLVCGDRNWTDLKAIQLRLNRLLDETEEFITVVEGEARGADTLGRQAAEELGIKVEAYPADWQQYGRAAGPIRNQQMLDSGIDLVLAFHHNLDKSKGTADMVRRVRRAGIEVEVIHGKENE